MIRIYLISVCCMVASIYSANRPFACDVAMYATETKMQRVDRHYAVVAKADQHGINSVKMQKLVSGLKYLLNHPDYVESTKKVLIRKVVNIVLSAACSSEWICVQELQRDIKDFSTLLQSFY